MSIELTDIRLFDERPKKDYIRKGFSIPFRVDDVGKIALSTGQQLDEEDILINILDNDNDNAFLQMQNYESLIFKQNSSDVKSQITIRLKKIFDMFENQHRMRLLEETIQIEQVSEYVYISFEYFNYETNQTKKLAIQGKT